MGEERIIGFKLLFGSLGCRGNAKISALSGLFPRGGVRFHIIHLGETRAKPRPTLSRGGPRKTSISALLTLPKPLTMWITRNCGKFFKRWEYQTTYNNTSTCLLRNLYAGQEATIRTGHGTIDWFQIGKGVCQACILSPCLFDLNAEYIMRNIGLEEAQLESKFSSVQFSHSVMSDSASP